MKKTKITKLPVVLGIICYFCPLVRLIQFIMISIDKIKEIIATWQDEIQDTIILTNNFQEISKVEGITVKSVLDWLMEN